MHYDQLAWKYFQLIWFYWKKTKDYTFLKPYCFLFFFIPLYIVQKYYREASRSYTLFHRIYSASKTICAKYRHIHMHYRKTKNFYIILHSLICLKYSIFIGLSVLSLLNKALPIYAVHNWAFLYPDRMFWSIVRQWLQELSQTLPKQNVPGGQWNGFNERSCKASSVLPVPSCWRPDHFLHKWQAPGETEKDNLTIITQLFFWNVSQYLQVIKKKSQ